MSWRCAHAGHRVSRAVHLSRPSYLNSYYVYSAAWRSTYYLCAGLAALAGTSALCVVPSDRPSTENDRRVDWLGAFLVTAGLVLIVFVLADGETAPKQWSTPCKKVQL